MDKDMDMDMGVVHTAVQRMRAAGKLSTPFSRYIA